MLLLFRPSGPPPAAVRRRGGDEALRQSDHQRQPAHLPAQQEVLWEIETGSEVTPAADTENHKAPPPTSPSCRCSFPCIIILIIVLMMWITRHALGSALWREV